MRDQTPPLTREVGSNPPAGDYPGDLPRSLVLGDRVRSRLNGRRGRIVHVLSSVPGFERYEVRWDETEEKPAYVSTYARRFLAPAFGPAPVSARIARVLEKARALAAEVAELEAAEDPEPITNPLPFRRGDRVEHVGAGVRRGASGRVVVPRWGNLVSVRWDDPPEYTGHYHPSALRLVERAHHVEAEGPALGLVC